MKKKRYIVEIDLFVWADSDDQARQEAKASTKKFEDANDAKVHRLHEAPWGIKGARKVELFN